MKKLLKPILLASLALTIIPLPISSNPAWAAPAQVQLKKSQNIVIHLKHYTDDFQAAFMALGLSNKLQAKGHKVKLLLSLRGVSLANKNQPHSHKLTEKGPRLSDLYKKFIKAGGEVIVCPHCSMMAGLKADQLMPGAKISSKGDFLNAIVDAEKVIDW